MGRRSTFATVQQSDTEASLRKGGSVTDMFINVLNNRREVIRVNILHFNYIHTSRLFTFGKFHVMFLAPMVNKSTPMTIE